MNIKRVAQALRLQESLTADEVMMLKVLQALTPTERELLVGSLQPEKVVKKRKAASKSPRAASLATAIARTPNQPNGAVNLDADAGPLCGICAHTADYEDHQQPSPHYHEFQGPQGVTAAGD